MYARDPNSTAASESGYALAGRFSDLIPRIRANDEAAVEELYRLLGPAVQAIILQRASREDLYDAVHDVFITSLTAIRNGTLRNPESLLAFARGVARRVAGTLVRQQNRCPSAIEGVDVADGDSSPEDLAQEHQRTLLMLRMLSKMPAKQREILKRFYVKGQSPVHICNCMNLTETQFRLLKWRAKAALVKISQRLRSSRLDTQSST